MVKKDKFGDFFGRVGDADKLPHKPQKPIGFFDTQPETDSKTTAPVPKPFFATPEEAEQERQKREQLRRQNLEGKRQAKLQKEKQARLARDKKECLRQAKIDAIAATKKRKLEEAKAYKLAQEKMKKDKAFIREQEKIIAQDKRDDRRRAAKGGLQVRGSRFYSTEMREQALENFKKYGTTKRPLQPNQTMVRKVLDIYAKIVL